MDHRLVQPVLGLQHDADPRVRVGPIRFQPQRRFITRLRRVVVAAGHFQVAQHVPGVGHGRLDRNRGVQVGAGFVVLPAAAQQTGQADVRGKEAAVGSQRRPKAGFRFAAAAERVQEIAQRELGFGIVGLQRQRAATMFAGGLEFAARLLDEGQVKMRLRPPRIVGQQPGINLLGLGQPSGLLKSQRVLQTSANARHGPSVE